MPLWRPFMPDRPRKATLNAGTVIAGRELLTVTGAPVAIPDAERLVHLQFRRLPVVRFAISTCVR